MDEDNQIAKMAVASSNNDGYNYVTNQYGDGTSLQSIFDMAMEGDAEALEVYEENYVKILVHATLEIGENINDKNKNFYMRDIIGGSQLPNVYENESICMGELSLDTHKPATPYKLLEEVERSCTNTDLARHDVVEVKLTDTGIELIQTHRI
jgi:hypothetical protein